MVSLKIKGGTKVEVAEGRVVAEGPTVLLIEFQKSKRVPERIAAGYCLIPGESVRRVGDGEDYVVEF